MEMTQIPFKLWDMNAKQHSAVRCWDSCALGANHWKVLAILQSASVLWAEAAQWPHQLLVIRSLSKTRNYLIIDLCVPRSLLPMDVLLGIMKTLIDTHVTSLDHDQCFVTSWSPIAWRLKPYIVWLLWLGTCKQCFWQYIDRWRYRKTNTAQRQNTTKSTSQCTNIYKWVNLFSAVHCSKHTFAVSGQIIGS